MRTKAIFAAMLLALAPLSITAQNIFQGLVSYDEGDYATALREFEPLAEQGDADAQFYLGLMYHNGLGVPQDYSEARRWYRLAAEQDHARGQSNLGLMYNRGWSVPQDYMVAHMWFNIAAANGNRTASTLRDGLSSKMTAADISEAQRRARVCMESNYQDCG